MSFPESFSHQSRRSDGGRPGAGGVLCPVSAPAALALADAGVRVTLLEGRPRLGGLAFSFQRGGLTVDNGQHVYLRCCTAYRWFLDRSRRGAGAAADRLDVPVVDVAKPEGRRLGRLRRDPLPVPLHLGAALAAYPHLSLAERVAVGRAALALKRSTSPIRRWTPRTSAAGWPRTASRRAPWRPRGTWSGSPPSTRSPGDASLGLAAMVVQDRSAVRPGRGRHRLGPRPAGRTARPAGPQGARLRGRPYRGPYTRHLRLSQRERDVERSGSPARTWKPTRSSSPYPSARPTRCCRPVPSTRPAGCWRSAPRPSSTSM